MLLLAVTLLTPCGLLILMMLMERMENQFIAVPEVDIERFIHRASPEEIEDYFQNGLHPAVAKEWAVRR